MRISDWSSDVCSSDLAITGATIALDQQSGASLYAILTAQGPDPVLFRLFSALGGGPVVAGIVLFAIFLSYVAGADANVSAMSALSTHGISPERPEAPLWVQAVRSEEHTSELQSLMRTSYAV